jgi:hypothetical protein
VSGDTLDVLKIEILKRKQLSEASLIAPSDNRAPFGDSRGD